MNTYKAHREAKKGEVCLGFVNNYTFQEMNWKTKRLGKKVKGLKENIYPVFVSEKEVKDSGIMRG